MRQTQLSRSSVAITVAAVAAVLALALIAASPAHAVCTPSGTPGGGSGNDVLCGTSGADTLNGKAGKDVLIGLGGNDRLDGGDGRSDFVHGNDGNDVVIGGLGFLDDVGGDSGNDQVLVRDGSQDVYTCGSGTDLLDMDLADAFNVPALALALLQCETITRGAVNEGPNVVISRRTPKIKDNGKVPVRLTCPASLAAPCAGTLTVGRPGKSAGAPQDYSIDPGSKDKVSARLSKGDRRKLSRHGEITASATSIEQGEHGDKTTVQTLELTAKD